MAESAAGEVRYLLSDGVGSVRQGVDETAAVIAYYEFDPYGNPVENEGGEPYGYTGEWWEDDVALLHLRARWYLPQDGVFLSRDPVESEPPYAYVRGNPVNLTDPRGTFPEALLRDSYGDNLVNFWRQNDKWWWDRMLEAEHGDVLISRDQKYVAQFVLDDPLARAYQNIWDKKLPWTQCDNPIKSPIKLEGFTEDGRYWSETSPIFAEIWRQNTGSFYYTGLHPNDPTWGQFVNNSQYANFRAYMSDHQRFVFGLYYANLQIGTSHIFQHIATALDAQATLISAQSTAAIDTTGLLLIGFGCASGDPRGCAAGASAAWEVNRFGSKVARWYDVRYGVRSLIATALSDGFGGYTTIANGRGRLGEGTVHTSITFLEGFVPETHFLLYTNIKQLLYDLGIDHHIDMGIYDVKAIEVD